MTCVFRLCLCVFQGVNVPKLEEAINSPRVADIIASHVTFCGRNLDLIPGASALLSNGRVSRRGGREGGSDRRKVEVSAYMWCNPTNSACSFVAADWSTVDQ